MVNTLRRLFWLAVLGGAAFAGWALWRAARQPVDGPARTDAPQPSPPDRAWVRPVDGQCPDGYPIKANDNSGIYHVPGGRFYARTRPQRCYRTAEAAEGDGYRRSKS